MRIQPGLDAGNCYTYAVGEECLSSWLRELKSRKACVLIRTPWFEGVRTLMLKDTLHLQQNCLNQNIQPDAGTGLDYLRGSLHDSPF